MSTPATAPPPPPAPDDADLLRPPPERPLRRVSPLVAAPTAAFFGSFSRLRGKRAMHPVGVVRTATLAVPEDERLPAGWRALDGAGGVVRLSKSIGTPRGLPDVLGIAVRFGEQDLLLASSFAPPLLQHLLVPATGFDRTTFSALLPHRVGNRFAVVQAVVAGRLPAADDPLTAVERAAALRLELSTLGLLGDRRPLATIDIGAVQTSQAAAAVRFDPWRCGAGLVPAGPFQRWRAPAYAASRRATRR